MLMSTLNVSIIYVVLESDTHTYTCVLSYGQNVNLFAQVLKLFISTERLGESLWGFH